MAHEATESDGKMFGDFVIIEHYAEPLYQKLEKLDRMVERIKAAARR